MDFFGEVLTIEQLGRRKAGEEWFSRDLIGVE